MKRERITDEIHEKYKKNHKEKKEVTSDYDIPCSFLSLKEKRKYLAFSL
jgi:hypothetical protein